MYVVLLKNISKRYIVVYVLLPTRKCGFTAHRMPLTWASVLGTNTFLPSALNWSLHEGDYDLCTYMACVLASCREDHAEMVGERLDDLLITSLFMQTSQLDAYSHAASQKSDISE